MAYTNPQDVRDLLGMDIETVGDAILLEFIDLAQEYIRKYVQIEILDGKLSGNINGENNTFSTEYAYYADTTGDTFITTGDFTVWGWAKGFKYDQFKRVELTVSTFDPLRGKIVLDTAPSADDYGRLTCDYSYYTKRINWKLLSHATAWKTAEMWVKREEFLVPETWVMGSKRIVQRQPWKYYEIEVRRIIDKLIALPMNKVHYKRLVFRPRGPEGPEVDSTGARDIKQKGKYVPDPEIVEEIVTSS